MTTAVPTAATRVVVAGDVNPDLILTGDVRPRFSQSEQLLTGADLVIGGSAAITAHGFARLGRPVSLVGAVGRDEFGDRMRAQLAAAGVDVRPVLQRADVPTGLTVVLAEATDRAILTLLGAIPSLTGAEVLAAVEQVAAGGRCHLHVSSLFLQPALAAELPDVLATVRAAGHSTSLDTNDDPSGRWAGVTALLPHLDLLLPNRSEALGLAGVAADPLDAARRLAAAGPLVVVKDGAAGATAVAADGTLWTVAAQPVVAVDTTGAGDTFDAAFVDAWLDGHQPAECLHRAVAAGAAAVGAVGGTAGQPSSPRSPERTR